MGGNAFPVARLTLQAPRGASNFAAGTKVYGVAKSHDRTVFGTLLEPVSWEEGAAANVTLEVAYFTTLFDNSPEENQCRVGGYYTFERANMNGCKYPWYLRLDFCESRMHSTLHSQNIFWYLFVCFCRLYRRVGYGRVGPTDPITRTGTSVFVRIRHSP